ncbi:sensor histidine kinase AruS-like, partial [Cydia pomonella]|uniref:sensor histidine kinase AruS-like n=1 Tax=Cydia pomonella TaxID=82600 RepID=UPI002ADE2263
MAFQTLVRGMPGRGRLARGGRRVRAPRQGAGRGHPAAHPAQCCPQPVTPAARIPEPGGHIAQRPTRAGRGRPPADLFPLRTRHTGRSHRRPKQPREASGRPDRELLQAGVLGVRARQHVRAGAAPAARAGPLPVAPRARHHQPADGVRGHAVVALVGAARVRQRGGLRVRRAPARRRRRAAARAGRHHPPAGTHSRVIATQLLRLR